MKYTPDYERRHYLGGPDSVIRKYTFPNGYAASVIRFKIQLPDGRRLDAGSYTSNNAEWEVAVLGPDGHLDYSTPITNDVLPHVHDDNLESVLDQIAALPPRVSV